MLIPCKNMIMNPNLLMSIILPVFICGPLHFNNESKTVGSSFRSTLSTVADIPVPEGYTRVDADPFGNWLRLLPLKKDPQVYLYNGSLKAYQGAQFAVLDIPVGTRDLQQCADAVMRLRAEYYFETGAFSKIVFYDNARRAYNFKPPYTRDHLQKYLEQVYGACGTLSLESSMKPVSRHTASQPGDVWIHGGSPGHAAIILDMARNAKGQLVALIANSYMPAQSIHIVRNMENALLSPWIRIEDHKGARLPEWQFYPGEIRRF